MRKSNADWKRESIARKRRHAREIGLCCICCKQRPNPGRTVCVSCNTAKTERTRRKRIKDQEAKRNSTLIAHERAGDVAREHDFHAAAAQHYQDALQAATATPDDHERLSRKLVKALSLSGEPDAVNPLYDQLLASYLATPGNGAKAVDIMLKMARQLWIDSKTNESLPIIMRAIQLAEKVGEHNLRARANLVMNNFCIILGRYDEAEKFLKNVGRIRNEPTAPLSLYYEGCALTAAVSGRAAKAYRYLDTALSIVRAEGDLYKATITWHDYSYCATILGDLDLAKSCTERALLISRQHHFVWYIPYLCLQYAKILTMLGQPSSAYDYLLEALSSDAHVPLLERALTEIGIPLAMQMNDEATLAKCTRPAVLTLVFQAEEPENISSVAAAFAKLYDAQGKREEAQTLLHRAVEAVRPTAWGWELPLEVARQGALADIPRARALLEARTVLPRSAVARACLHLFDAYVARRERTSSLVHAHAKDALERFETLHWYAYAEEARSLLPDVRKTLPSNQGHSLPFTDMQSVLTTREQEVAGFVLRGLTNRAIAAELSVTQNTVEKHMTSIMNRLEIRSRHQLAAAIESREP